jgi:hypothetical protein
MSIEDITYLKKNSIKQSYSFLIDSKDRDRISYPEPNNYVISFSSPFKNVIGFDILDASIPRTMYSVDYNNNKLIYYIAEDDTDDIYVNGLSNIDVNNITYPDTSSFHTLNMPTGDYTIQTFIPAFNTYTRANNINLQIKSYTNPPEVKNLVKFISPKPFILDMGNSTISETLGFDLYTQPNEASNTDVGKRYKYISKYGANQTFRKIYHSFYSEIDKAHIIIGPGTIYFMGNRYVIIRCPEIEQHLYRSLSYSKYNLGLAKIRVSSYGYNDEKIDFTKITTREFHPIGKLPKLSFRFETPEGDLYDFKGVNHNILYTIYYYEPTSNKEFTNPILNPNYKGNFINYMYTNDEQQGDSDDDEEEFNKSNINIYKKKELLYSEDGINISNSKIADEFDNYTSSDSGEYSE